MSCTGGTGQYSYSLTGGAQGQSSNQFVVSPTATTTYSMTATDSAQATTSKNATVTVSTGGGGSGGGGPISCPGYSSTQTVNLAWSTGASATIPAGESDAIVITFTPLGEIGASGSSITAFEYGSSAAPRFAVLSTTPCDFAYQPAQLGIYASQSGTTVSQKMNLPGGTKTQAVKIVAGTKYYWNIQMAPGTCGGNCQMRTTITP